VLNCAKGSDLPPMDAVKYAPFNEKTVQYFRDCIDPKNWLLCAEGGK
jgi:hypothetical protein